jgi:hypothetical protein
VLFRSGKSRRVQQGESINGMLVAEVKADRVRLALGNESEELVLKVATNSRPTPAAPVAGQAAPGAAAPTAGAPAAPMTAGAPPIAPLPQGAAQTLAVPQVLRLKIYAHVPHRRTPAWTQRE